MTPKYSADWFAVAQAALGRTPRPEDAKALDQILIGRTSTLAAGKPATHFQVFEAGELVDWCSAETVAERYPRLEPIVWVHTPGDLRLDSRPEPLTASVSLPSHPHRRTDVLGLGPTLERRVGPVRSPGLRLKVVVDVGFDDQVRHVQCLEVTENDVRTKPELEPEPDIWITAPYDSIITWLHDPVALLGHMIIEGQEVRGDIASLSAAEGIVSAEPARDTDRTWASCFLLAVPAYVRLCSTPAYRAAIARVQESTG